MKNKGLALMAAVSAIAILGCTWTPPVIDHAAAEAAVTALVEEWSRAGEESRWNDLKALYADEPGFAWIEQGRVAYADYAAVIAGVDQAAAMGAKIESEVSEVSVAPLSDDAAAFHARAARRRAAPPISRSTSTALFPA
jgi:hypothetical protein